MPDIRLWSLVAPDSLAVTVGVLLPGLKSEVGRSPFFPIISINFHFIRDEYTDQ